MASVNNVDTGPDVAAIAQHLALLFEPCISEYPNGLVEIAHGFPGPDRANLFPITKQGLAEAVDYAAAQSNSGQNVYVGVNPRRPHTPDNKRASARDVEISFWHFADLDHEEVVTLARKRLEAMDIKATARVTTGLIPTPRVHLYWRLEEPVRNLESWSERQKGIADTLGGDAVIDPPRVMRLAGTVSYPSPDKAKRGYISEPITIRTEFDDERLPVTPEQIAHHFPRKAADPVQPEARQPQEGETTLAAMARTQSEDLIRACQAGDQWHNNMVRLVAHLVGIGTPASVILAIAPTITLSGYTVADTLADMKKALQGAYDKGWAQKEEPAVEQGEEQREGIFQTLSLDDLESLPPPTYLVDGLLPEFGLTIAYGDPGAGKSFIVLDAALRLAYGMDWHGRPAKQVGVLYIAGEGRHGLGKRVKGWRKEHALEGADAPFKLLPVAVHMLDGDSVDKLKRTIAAVQQELDFKIGLVIIDTVSRAIAGQDENKQDAMSLFVDGCGSVQEFIGGAVIGVHHSGKDKDKGMRGSTVLLGGCDAAMKVAKDDLSVTITVEKQKDDEEGAPIQLTMKKVEWSEGLAKPMSTLVPGIPDTPPPSVTAQASLTRHQRVQILEEISRRWNKRDDGVPPFSDNRVAKSRWVSRWIKSNFDISLTEAQRLIERWTDKGLLSVEKYDKRNGSLGIRVVSIPEDWRS